MAKMCSPGEIRVRGCVPHQQTVEKVHQFNVVGQRGDKGGRTDDAAGRFRTSYAKDSPRKSDLFTNLQKTYVKKSSAQRRTCGKRAWCYCLTINPGC